MRKFEEDNSSGDDNLWLVSFADMMNLIACFFILMMSFANFDPVAFNNKAEEVAEHFTKQHDKPSELDLKTMQQEVTKHELKDRLKVSLKDSELVITFSTSLLFPNDVSLMDKETENTMESLIDILKVSNSNYRILIEGHADDVLVENSIHKSQWEVSIKRAAQVAAKFEAFGFPKENIVPVGRSNSQKVYESTNKYGDRIEDLAKFNRRVVVRVLEPYKKKKIKLGLGVYFRDATQDVKDNSLNPEEIEKFEIK